MIASGCMSTECSAAAEQTLAEARRVPQHMFYGWRQRSSAPAWMAGRARKRGAWVLLLHKRAARQGGGGGRSLKRAARYVCVWV